VFAVPSIVHSAVVPIGHEVLWHAPAAQVTSHLQLLAHSTSWHAALPVQVTSHDPGPQVTSSQPSPAVQSTSQLAADAHMTFVHAFVALQVTAHDIVVPQ
jgi:hypothetical protein